MNLPYLISPSSVRERFQKMEDLGVIKSYGVAIEHAMLGNGSEVFIRLKIFSD